ncbi:drug/metabolite transporter (DMT)-like permease [Kitasatospora sp. GAS204A]|uniref:EamA family transporter n=1 Tax=unclassified Kitasatospora TaxID=2633591 RepID=UPI002474A09E|nr:EamA family transporter [Kitasatospora sp. GAS204B]MDH6118375.1 drug/metabolite transporter (DMT)-like permease [Kitasatospora sp. GAS204B]
MTSIGTGRSAGPADSGRAAPPAGPAALDGGARISGTVWAALAVVYVVWGSTYLGIRIMVETMPALLGAAARFLFAGALLLGVLAWRLGPAALRVTRRQLGSTALVGVLLLVGGNGLLVLAEGRVPSGLAALLVAVVPLWVVVLRTATGDRPGGAALVGVLLGLGGLAVLSAPGLSGDVSLGGLVLIMLGAISWAVGSFISGRLPMPANPLVASAYEMLIGGLGCLLVAVARGEELHLHLGAVSTRSWVALVYLIVVGSLVGFTAYAWLLQSAPLGLVATYAYVNPVVAVFLGWLVLAERLTLSELLGGAIVVLAVCVVVSTERRR